jgi:hypothetical protein
MCSRLRTTGAAAAALVAIVLHLPAAAYPTGYAGYGCPGALGDVAGVPAHGAATFNAPGGFSLGLADAATGANATSYAPGRAYTLTLGGDGNAFRGFIVAPFAGRAASAFDAPKAGRLAPSSAGGGAQPMRSPGCDGGLTHVDNARKTGAAFAWTPPGPGEAGHGGTVTFWALVVPSLRAFNWQVRLTVPSEGGEGGGAPPEQPQPSATPTFPGGGSGGGASPTSSPTSAQFAVLRAASPRITLEWAAAVARSSDGGGSSGPAPDAATAAVVASFRMVAEGKTYLGFAGSPGPMVHDGTPHGSGPAVIGEFDRGDGNGSGGSSGVDDVAGAVAVDAAGVSTSSTGAADMPPQDDRRRVLLPADAPIPASASGTVGLFYLQGKTEAGVVPVAPRLAAAALLDATIAFNGSHTVMAWARPLAPPPPGSDASDAPIQAGVPSPFIWAASPPGADGSGSLRFHGARCGRGVLTFSSGGSGGGGVTSLSPSPPPPTGGIVTGSYTARLGPRLTLSWAPAAVGAASAAAAAAATSPPSLSTGAVSLTLNYSLPPGTAPSWAGVAVNTRSPDMYGAHAVVVEPLVGASPPTYAVHTRYLSGHSMGAPSAGGAGGLDGVTTTSAAVAASAPDGSWVAVRWVWSGLPLGGGAHIIWATGGDGQAYLGPHATSDDARGAASVVFADGTVAAATTRAAGSRAALRLAHAVVTAAGWALLVGGVLAARYLRRGPGTGTVTGTRPRVAADLWFRLHRRCQLLGTALVVAGVGVGVAMTDPPDGHFTTTHARLGLAAAAGAVAQLANAALRPPPPKPGGRPSPARAAWCALHRGLGYACVGGAVAAAALGVPLLAAGDEAARRLGYGLLAAVAGGLAAAAAVCETRARCGGGGWRRGHGGSGGGSGSGLAITSGAQAGGSGKGGGSSGVAPERSPSAPPAADGGHEAGAGAAATVEAQ